MSKCPVCGSEKHRAMAFRQWGEGWVRLCVADTDCYVTPHVCLKCGALYIPDEQLKEMKGE